MTPELVGILGAILFILAGIAFGFSLTVYLMTYQINHGHLPSNLKEHREQLLSLLKGGDEYLKAPDSGSGLEVNSQQKIFERRKRNGKKA